MGETFQNFELEGLENFPNEIHDENSYTAINEFHCDKFRFDNLNSI